MPTKTVYIFTLYLSFFSAWTKSVGFLLFFFQKKQKDDLEGRKSRQEVFQASCGGPEAGVSLELLVERFNKKIYRTPRNQKRGFGIGIERCQLQQRFICG